MDETKTARSENARARYVRAEREREWEATKPGINLYENPDLRQYMEKLKLEDPNFAEFCDKVKSGEISMDYIAEELAKRLAESGKGDKDGNGSDR